MPILLFRELFSRFDKGRIVLENLDHTIKAKQIDGAIIDKFYSEFLDLVERELYKSPAGTRIWLTVNPKTRLPTQDEARILIDQLLIVIDQNSIFKKVAALLVDGKYLFACKVNGFGYTRVANIVSWESRLLSKININTSGILLNNANNNHRALVDQINSIIESSDQDDLTFDLGKSSPGRPDLFWFTNADDVCSIIEKVIPDQAATEVRNTMGLAHYKNQFLIQLTIPSTLLDCNDIGVPTTFEGFEHARFKAQSDHPNPNSGWTADIKKIAEYFSPASSKSLDGIPEFISQPIKFSPGLGCKLNSIGKVNNLNIDVSDNEYADILTDYAR